MQNEQIGATAAYGFAHFGVKGTFEDYVWCFKRLSELGYTAFNLEVLEDDHVEMFTPDRIDRFRGLGEELGIRLPIFTTYYAENDLVSLDPKRRRKGVEKFKFCVETAARLGSRIMNLASEFPPELVQEYRPEYVHSPAAKFAIPASVSWESIWDAQVEAMQLCADISHEQGMQLSLEPRANCLVSTIDSFLRLAEHVGRTNFGCSLDIMHVHFHREDIPTAIKKLGSRLIDVQASDADGQSIRHLTIGEGNINFPEVIRALDEIKFKGMVGVELMGIEREKVDKGYLDSRLALEDLFTHSSNRSATA
jgi:D-psicose/D-tagatose/L-ribulose 3-epimerase